MNETRPLLGLKQNNAMGSFEGLEVYKLSRKFRKEVSMVSKSLPYEEKYRLQDQIIRSSRSISAQIAEGHGRYHYQENIQFCRVARGSLEETHDHLNVALDEGYIDERTHNGLITDKYEILRVLNGYIRYLRKSKKGEF